MVIIGESRYRFVTGALVFLVLLSMGILWVAAGPLIPSMIEEYGVSRGTVSWAVSLISIMMAIFAVPSSILATKIGVKKVFTIGAFLQAVSILTPISFSFSMVLLTRCLFGVGTAMTFPIAGGIVAQWFSSKEQSLVNGLNASATTLGNAIALFITVPIATALSWKAPLTIYGVLALVFAIGWLIFGREQQMFTSNSQVTNDSKVAVSSIFKQKTTWLLAGCMVGPFCLFMAISSWLPTYYNEVFGIPMTKASAITAIFTISGIPACILGGILPIVLAVALAIANLGGFMGPLIVGYLADLTDSYVPGLVLCCILLWSLFIGGRLLPETGPKAKR